MTAKSPASDKPAARLMLAGISLAFGPSMILWGIPALLGTPLSEGLTVAIIDFAVPLLPFFYIYALFKRHLGTLEFRANRLLGMYSFILLYACVFILAFSIGNQLPKLPGNLAIIELAISAGFLVGALPLYRHFQRLFNRLAYGARYQPDDVIHAFAHQIPTALDLDALTELLADEIAPSLFIRESAVYVVADRYARLLYVRGVSPQETMETASRLDRLLAEAGQYRPHPTDPHDTFDWVRLAIPLETRQRVIGVWLFGRRDPDDYYPQSDVKLLNTLASQVAIALENAQLYDQAHQRVVERERAEQAARESEEMVRALLNATTESVFLLDTQLTILALNQTAARRFGRDVDELVGLSISDLVTRGILPSETAALRKDQLDEVIRSGDPARFEDEREDIAFDTSVYPILDTAGNVAQLALFARDITAQRAAEQQAIHVERLAAVGRLASALAHEINNPLQAVRANLELMLDFDLEPSERKENLGAIREEIDRLAEISQRMLNLAHQSSDTRQPVPMALLVERALALMHEQLQRTHIQVTVDMPDDLLPVSVAPGQIIQVLLNLALNAVEAMPNGGHLHIAARTYGSMLALTMINDSPPLPPEHIARIFDPFFTTKMDGAGLGLYISRQIIQRHDGTIGVENLENGQGVAFTLTLPRADVT